MQHKSTLLLFKALGEETKFRILEILINGEYCACEIPSLIKRTQPNTSMNLAKLQKWGIIKYRRDGKMIIYTIKDKRIFNIFKSLGYSKGEFEWKKVKVCQQ
ncbi:winged helix-turn-helix transcriptional regulator [Candidatus Woesearchaeota archaeon]|nr:winged helix-turn-helix transcriptional regulator [Candidatus Woesearchaeota archaeon]